MVSDRIGGNMARRKKYDYKPIPQRKTVKVKEDLTADVYLSLIHI